MKLREPDFAAKKITRTSLLKYNPEFALKKNPARVYRIRA